MVNDLDPGNKRSIDVESYELSMSAMNSRIKSFLAEHEPQTKEHIVCYEVGPDSPLSDVARTVERIVFEKRFGNTSSDMAKIYGPYEESSRFFLSVDRENGEPVGALRVSTHSEAGLMTLNSLPEGMKPNLEQLEATHNIQSLDDCWDVGTVAVLPAYRKQGIGVSTQLYRGMYKSAMNEGIQHLLAIIDEKPLETMTKYLGIPFVPLMGLPPFSFEGSESSTAVYGYVPDFYQKMKKKSITVRGIMARKALWPLVFGTKDDTIYLPRE